MTVPDFNALTDEEVLTAVTAQARQQYPTGLPQGDTEAITYIDVVDGWGAIQSIEAACERLVAAGKLVRTSSGNYMPS